MAGNHTMNGTGGARPTSGSLPWPSPLLALPPFHAVRLGLSQVDDLLRSLPDTSETAGRLLGGLFQLGASKAAARQAAAAAASGQLGRPWAGGMLVLCRLMCIGGQHSLAS
jgi:hypothetical protein